MTETAAAALVGQTLGGKFFVRRQLGSGGMGAVYEVQHVVTKRVGALKLLHAHRAAVGDVVARFVREASAAAHIENPHIVSAYDAGELPSGEPYLFMELLEGSPISALIAARGRLSFQEAREIVVQTAEALAAAHRAGIVHRDIKPENLFYCRGPSPFVKVLDFGISKFAPQLSEYPQLTQDGAPMGSPSYMSPEQVVGKRDLDFRTDVYSLGVVLYECLTGQVPFTAETLMELGVKIFEGRYARASELVPELPAGLDELLAKAMALEASDRYESMSAFRSALLGLAPQLGSAKVSTLVITEPPAVAPVLTRPRPAAHGSARRSRWAWVLTASVALALLAAAVGFGISRESVEPSPLASSALRIEPERVAPARPSATPGAELGARAEGAAGEHALGALSTAAPGSASPAPRPAKAPAAARAPGAPSSRARRDGLVEANPF